MRLQRLFHRSETQIQQHIDDFDARNLMSLDLNQWFTVCLKQHQPLQYISNTHTAELEIG